MQVKEEKVTINGGAGQLQRQLVEISQFMQVKEEKATINGGAGQLQRQLVDYTASLFHEGYLNDQFTQLQQLQDESSPDFVVEVVSLFFEDYQRLLNELAKALDQQTIDYKRVDSHAHQLKGSSSSIGAERVQHFCILFRNFCEAQNKEGCLKCLQQIRNEFFLVKNKLETLFKLEQQIMSAHR